MKGGLMASLRSLPLHPLTERQQLSRDFWSAMRDLGPILVLILVGFVLLEARSGGVVYKQITLRQPNSSVAVPTYAEACSRYHKRSQVGFKNCLTTAPKLPGNPPAGELYWGIKIKIPVYR
jgi:hypothetical protein